MSTLPLTPATVIAPSNHRTSARTPRWLGSAGRLLAQLVHPVPALKGIAGGAVTILGVSAIWTLLTFTVAHATRHITVDTPFGLHHATISISRVPAGATFALALIALLFGVAAFHLQRARDAAGR
jgi:hypothetical protein